MTAPPTQRPLFVFSETRRLHAGTAGATSYLSPVSTASDSESPWPSMAPLQGGNDPQPVRGPSRSPPSNKRNANASSPNGLLFITGTTPEEFKSKKNMTKVRKKAMGSYLEKGKQPREASRDSLRGVSEGSTYSRSNFGIDDVMENSEALMMWKDEGGRPGWRAGTPTDSTYERSVSTPDSQHSTMPSMAMDFMLPTAPMVLPSRTDVALPYDHYTPKPFESIGKPLDPFSSMYQASHPKVSVEQLKWYCSRSFGTKAMGLHWITTLVKSPHAFLSTLCIASAHYDAIQERPIESVQTLALRQEVMHLISKSLVNPQSRIDDYNIAALTQLIVSEMISGQESALNYHESGVGAMIKQRGGLAKLGANGRIASTISWVSLESAIFRETAPDAVYTEYYAPTTTKSYQSTKPLPESPLYCPKGEYDTVKKSTRCTPRTSDLLKDMRMLLDLFLHETERSRQNALSLKNIYKRLTTQYLPAAELRKTEVMTPNEWRYEAVRVASIITATAITKRVPLSEALAHAAEVESKNWSTPNDSFGSPTSLRHDSPTATLSSSPLFVVPSDQTNPFAFTPATPTSTSTTSPYASRHRKPSIPATTTLLTHLKQALQSSDLSDCWADMAGVLFWLALTVSAATRTADKVLRKWFRALAARVSIVLCFEHPEAVHRGCLRLGELVQGLAFREKGVGEAGRRGSAATGAVGKRRKV
ncbi:hypothetical protein K458DRAFT_198548 [Lentithecium fluviatile CBS 122367]|uniref:Uncharacterized protein n=1 Tax=Lentithecium fluviatile CBS 122367 TaxID=1168545 RepID=A0A6G1J8M0_9PLEO|nr:hypothetical protein K458DRAFT_198548 [Lentithecium fluviatile CBS 122367]